MKKAKTLLICAAAFALAAGAVSSFAAGRGGHGGGGYHGGGGHYHGGGNWHGHGYWRGGVYIGLGGYYGPYWPYWGYPYSYGYAYPSYYAAPYYSAPTYVEQEPIQPPSAQPARPQGYWYFCPDSRQYYPSVQSCPSEWQRVPPTPPPG